MSAQADNGFIQINEEIVVGLGALNKTGGSAGEELRIGDTVRISGTWDAPDSPDLQPGDGFRMTLPEEFQSTSTDTFSMGGWGTCVIEAGVLECAVNDLVVGMSEISGTFELELEAVARTNEDAVSFLIESGDPILVELPGEGGIALARDMPSASSKNGQKISNTEFEWTIELPGYLLNDHNIAAPYRIVDTPTGGHGLKAPVVDAELNAWRYDDRGNTVPETVSGGSLNISESGDDIHIDLDPGPAGWNDEVVYKITYRTQADGLGHPDTEYGNTAVLPDGVVGVGAPFKPVWKSGTFRQASDRYQHIDWTIDVPGNMAENGRILIEDTLTGLQGVCEATEATVNGSAVGVTTTTSETNDKKFSIEFPADNGTSAADIYQVKYTTCYTGNEKHPAGSIPPSQSKFTNAAVIGGDVTVSASVTSPRYYSNKAGMGVNTGEKTLDGVTHPAGTTMNWEFTISGADLASPVTITDTPTGGHGVCAPEGDLSAAMGLTFRAEDRVAGGDLKDESFQVTPALGENGEILFTMTSDQGFSVDYKYVVAYTTCTTSGGVDESGTTYGNGIEGSGITSTASIRQDFRPSATGSGVAGGSFTVNKTLSGAAAAAVTAADPTFTVRVEEFKDAARLAANEPNVSYNRELKASEDINGLYARGDGWLIRLSEPTFPEVAGVSFTPTFAPAEGDERVEVASDGRSAVITVQRGTNVGVTLDNSADYGAVTVAKEIQGAAAELARARSFDVTATITTPGGATEDRPFTLQGDGTPHTLEDLPIGATVTFAEDDLVDTDDITWGAPVFNPNSVQVAAGEPAQVTLTNTAEQSVGSFSLAKSVLGTEADNPNLPETYTVTATWVDADGEERSQDMVLPLDGEAVAFGEELLAGTEVTLKENIPADVNNLAWAAPAFSGEGISIVDGETVFTVGLGNAELSVTNTVVEMGTLQLVKTISGEGESFVGEEAEFEVFAQWRNSDAEEFDSTTLTLRNDGVPVPLGVDLPVGTEVRFTETGTADIEGVAWGAATWSGADWLDDSGDIATGVITDETAEGGLISLNNEAQWADRPVNIIKQIEGEAAEQVTAEHFVVTATFPDTGESQTFNIRADEPANIGSFPVGTTIQFMETAPADTDQVTWGEPVFEPGSEITIGEEDLSVDVALRNFAEPTHGSFTLTKVLNGPEAGNENAPDSFQVLASWTDPAGAAQERTLTVPVGETYVFEEQLLNGTEVTLREILPANGQGMAWGVPVFSGDVSQAQDGGGVLTIGLAQQNVTLSNFVDRNDGTLRITKAVSGEAAEAVPADAEFTVAATWEGGSRELLVKAGESTPLGVDLPVGTEVSFTEIGRPAIAGVEWGGISWGTVPVDESWLNVDAQGVATGVISDNNLEGGLITLGNEALWQPGALGFEKLIDINGEIVPAPEAELPAGAEFKVEIESIKLPEGKTLPVAAGIAEGDTITLNAANNYRWISDKELPKGTTVTFTELQPTALPGLDWGLPAYDPELTVTADGESIAQITNRAIPTTEVDIDKIVSGPKGEAVENSDSTYFQVTADWKDIDGQERSCVLNVVPGESAVPATGCEAAVLDGKVCFPTDTEITFTETGATTGVTNVTWGEVNWSVAQGAAELTELEGAATAIQVNLEAAAEPVVLGLENETSSKGLIFIPLPIPLPPLPGFPDLSPFPDSPGVVDPLTPENPGSPGDPEGSGNVDPTTPDPQEGTNPQEPEGVEAATPERVVPGAPGDPVSAQPQGGEPESGVASQAGLAATGANVLWLVGGALLLLIAGAWLALRGRGTSTRG